MAEHNFNHFDEELQKVLKAAESGMEKAVIELEADTKLITHVDTGTLRRSWTHKTRASQNGIIEGAVGSNVEYAPFEDQYHGNLSVALNENLQQYIEVISDEIKNAIGG